MLDHPTPAAPRPIIEARDLFKSYHSGDGLPVQALRGVSLTIEPGEMVAIMGPSGCGKTTLLNSLAGLDGIDQGEIYIEGTPLHTMSDRQRTTLRAERMGFIFQSYNLMPILTAVENVELPLLLLGVSASEARQRATQALALVELAAKVNRLPAELSGGQQQRVTIARALVNQPAIVWADEPTGALDSKSSEIIMALLGELNEKIGQTCVVVTHDPQVAARAHRVIHMLDGTIERYAHRAPVRPTAGAGA